jgi:Outer membrane protein beta-barrel domain
MSSQNRIEFSARGGVNFTNYHYKYQQNTRTEQPESAGLITVSLPVEINRNKRFSYQAELNFIQKGYKLNRFASVGQRPYGSDSITLITNWLESPLLVKMKLFSARNIGFSLFGGPSLGLGISGRIRNQYKIIRYTSITMSETTIGVESEKVNFIKDHNLFEIGLNVGGEIKYKKLYLDFRYQIGISDTRSKYYIYPEISSSKTRSTALTLGYLFFTKSIKKS